MHEIFVCFSAISFLGFGFACFFWVPMQREYVRYGVPRFRPLVGVLQIAGGLGLLAGFAVPLVGQLAAAGLALLMFLGVCLRIRIRDSLVQTLPALFYFVLNAYLAVAGFRQEGLPSEPARPDAGLELRTTSPAFQGLRNPAEERVSGLKPPSRMKESAAGIKAAPAPRP